MRTGDFLKDMPQGGAIGDPELKVPIPHPLVSPTAGL